ncbi:copper resistance protein NlpE [Sutterella seckii]|uniref:Copper resistance protein NlpE n=1 Tax=Sutterella seckii TaxID=1944635 RepID=A0A6I1EPX6_9BURK|nr:copper resistance protein NlpE [Sutterella seckii]KAB7662617.1 copper resistance protein NlpE [Sutterella seckii]
MPLSLIRPFAICAALALSLSGCTAPSNGAKEAASPQAGAASEVAGVYEGMLPCADCEGIRTALYLRASGTYTRVSHYLGTDGAFDEGGKWSFEGGKLRFDSAAPGEGPWYALPIPNGVRLLDREGKPVEGVLAPMYDLMRP